MAYETYGQINGVIREIQRGDSCCSQILRLDTENGEVRFTVMLNFFDENLVAEDNSLRLNLSPVTNIMTQNGQRFTCSPRNMELLVYYTNTTFSIPPMTTPQKVIVMCEM